MSGTGTFVTDEVTDVADRLERWLESSSLDGVVTELHRLSGGSSRENWSFDLVAGDDVRTLLLRRDPVGGVAETDRRVEIGVLRALEPTAVPAPKVVLDDPDGEWMGRPTVLMERAAGRADRAALRSRDPLQLGDPGRRQLARALQEQLAAIHAVDAATFEPVFGSAPDDPARTEIRRWEAQLARVRLGAEPELAWVACWLDEHAPRPSQPACLVHGDYRPANVLVADSGSLTVLDWEFAHLGDPVEDLGWYLAPIYTAEHLVDPSWQVRDVLDAYASAFGQADPIDPARLHFWQVLATFKLAVIALAGVRSFVDGTSDRAAAPAVDVARRAVETALTATTTGTTVGSAHGARA